MYPQTEYALAYALTFAFVILGFLVVCIPRPRKVADLSKEEVAKEKKKKEKEKAIAKSKKAAAKAKKAASKQRKKAKKK
jgi:Na+-transporting methylmalonyl-CoA/oxaloacetate decarboxylase gamma subunit